VVAEIKWWEAGRRSREPGWKRAEVEGQEGEVEAARRTGWHMSVIDGEVAVGIRIGARRRNMCGIEDVVVHEIHLKEKDQYSKRKTGGSQCAWAF